MFLSPLALTFDSTIRLTDVATVVAALLSPLIALQISEVIRHRKEARARKIHVFRILMSTRRANLSPNHVEALNLIDLEFNAADSNERKVINSWKLYHAHLSDAQYAKDSWESRRIELLVDMLHEMAGLLGFGFDKAHIKNSSYSPQAHGDTEAEQQQLRRALLKAFEAGALKIAPSVQPPIPKSPNVLKA